MQLLLLHNQLPLIYAQRGSPLSLSLLQLKTLADRKETAIGGAVAVNNLIGTASLLLACQQIGIAGIIVQFLIGKIFL